MQSYSNIQSLLQTSLRETSELIRKSLESDISLLEGINGHLLDHSGKFLRPVLCLLSAGAAGGITEESVRYAAASELLHNATLLHDDVVDGSTSRRGEPTVSAVLGSPAAVLVGDFWLVRAVQCILGSENSNGRVIRLFAATLSHLSEGEMLQMEKAGTADTSREDYLRIIFSKTASLFKTAATAGAISAGAPQDVEQILGEFGRCIGIAFQMQDDILDYTPSASLGKPTGQDIMEQKITAPLLMAFEGASAEEESSIRSAVRGVIDNPSLAEGVRDFVASRRGTEKAAGWASDYIAKAEALLEKLPEGEYRDALGDFARIVGERTK